MAHFPRQIALSGLNTINGTLDKLPVEQTVFLRYQPSEVAVLLELGRWNVTIPGIWNRLPQKDPSVQALASVKIGASTLKACRLSVVEGLKSLNAIELRGQIGREHLLENAFFFVASVASPCKVRKNRSIAPAQAA
jgi:hypothetical protein